MNFIMEFWRCSFVPVRLNWAIAAQVASQVGQQMLTENQARDDATTSFNRTMALDQWLGSNQMQWRVGDLKAAGLNPALAAGGALGGFQTQMSPSIQTAGAAPGVSAGQIAAQTAQAKLAGSQAQMNTSQAGLYDAQAEKLRRETPGAQAAQAAGTTSNLASAQQADTQSQSLLAGLGKIAQDISESKARTSGQEISNETASQLLPVVVHLKAMEDKLRTLEVPRSDLESKAASSLGQIWDYANKRLPEIGDLVGQKAADVTDAIGDWWHGLWTSAKAAKQPGYMNRYDR